MNASFFFFFFLLLALSFARWRITKGEGGSEGGGRGRFGFWILFLSIVMHACDAMLCHHDEGRREEIEAEALVLRRLSVGPFGIISSMIMIRSQAGKHDENDTRKILLLKKGHLFIVYFSQNKK